jgi:GntR family transcriptional regulator / MocR family aminotransferase
MTMSLPRRLALLAWARRNAAWIIEDDYLSELQLKGRAAPALASLDHGGRVLHIGNYQQDDQPGAAPRFHGGAAGTLSSVR